jgi:hypothetical protein
MSHEPQRVPRQRPAWCSAIDFPAPGPGVQRCPRCGRRLRAYPRFDDRPRGAGRLAPGTGRDTIRERGVEAAEDWMFRAHKLAKAKRP